MQKTVSPSISFILSQQQSPICPYLGLRSEPSVVTNYATEQHVCYTKKQRATPSLEHQGLYCLTNGYGECPFYSRATAGAPQPAPVASHHKHAKLIRQLMILVLFVLLVDVALFSISYVRNFKKPGSLEEVTAVTPAIGIATTMLTPSVADLLPTVTPTAPNAVAGGEPASSAKNQEVGQSLPVSDRFFTPTPEPGGLVTYITPRSDRVAWWYSGDNGVRQIGDSFLYAGEYNQQSYISAVRFDLSGLTRGAPIREVTLRLMGLRNVGITGGLSTRWIVQFIAEESLSNFATASYLSVFSAPAAITLLPELEAADLGVGQVNQWQLDQNFRLWLENQLNMGATSVTLRIMASTNAGSGLFGWDSGQGSESSSNPPGLLVSMGPPPATPPPLPTRPVIVATLTPLPQNVMTAVAQFATATAQAIAIGTPTPRNFDVVTPTPLPENLATVQANAMAQGLPAVIMHTPIPANGATATADAAYATAVALTTGTFTPVPTGYVTPVLIYPPPPAENVATAAARVMIATQEAQSGTPTPTVPWNSVNAIYVYATATPASAEEAAELIREQNAAALTTGTPTPTPWNLVVITAVPSPMPTEIPIIVPADQIAPTPTPVPTMPATVQDLATFRGQILFLSNRTGQEETWAMDAQTGELLYLVRDTRLHRFARELYLGNSPDGNERAIVEEDANRDLQIKVYSLTYQTTRQITTFAGATSYDPAWSPLGDRIAFVSTQSGGDEIYVIDPQGNNLVQLTSNSWEWDKHPTWSPDGSQIAFYSNRDSGRKQIWIMNADGSNQRNLSNDEFENWDPVWIR